MKYLEEAGRPRLVILAVLAITLAAGFLASVAMVHLGVDRMYVRYPLAVAVAYATFLGLPLQSGRVRSCGGPGSRHWSPPSFSAWSDSESSDSSLAHARQNEKARKPDIHGKPDIHELDGQHGKPEESQKARESQTSTNSMVSAIDQRTHYRSGQGKARHPRKGKARHPRKATRKARHPRTRWSEQSTSALIFGAVRVRPNGTDLRVCVTA